MARDNDDESAGICNLRPTQRTRRQKEIVLGEGQESMSQQAGDTGGSPPVSGEEGKRYYYSYEKSSSRLVGSREVYRLGSLHPQYKYTMHCSVTGNSGNPYVRASGRYQLGNGQVGGQVDNIIGSPELVGRQEGSNNGKQRMVGHIEVVECQNTRHRNIMTGSGLSGKPLS